MPIRRELIDDLLKDDAHPQDILAEDGLLKQLTKAVIERCLETELDTHLGYPKPARTGPAPGTRRTGHRQKTLKGEQGPVRLAVMPPQAIARALPREIEGCAHRAELQRSGGIAGPYGLAPAAKRLRVVGFKILAFDAALGSVGKSFAFDDDHGSAFVTFVHDHHGGDRVVERSQPSVIVTNG